MLSWKEVADWFSYVVISKPSKLLMEWNMNAEWVELIDFHSSFRFMDHLKVTNYKWLNKKVSSLRRNFIFTRHSETLFRLHFACGEIWHYCMWRFKLPAKKKPTSISVNLRWRIMLMQNWIPTNGSRVAAKSNLCGVFFHRSNYHNVFCLKTLENEKLNDSVFWLFTQSIIGFHRKPKAFLNF